MALFRRSLSEDDVDRHNHTWAVFFLLVLSLVTWLLPLSPYLQARSDNPVTLNSPGLGPETLRDPVPRFKAVCWCPVEFTQNMVSYATAMCGAAYNNAVRGVNHTEHGLPASLYQLDMDRPVPMDGAERDALKLAWVKHKQEERKVKVEAEAEDARQNAKNYQKAKQFTHVTVPSVLFIMAICLKIPHILWRLLTCAVGGVNVDQTLASAGASAGLDLANRRELHSELATVVSRDIRACPSTASALYVFFKFLMVVAVVVELVVVHSTLLPQAKDLVSKPAVSGSVASGQGMKSVVEKAYNIGNSVSENENKYLSQMLTCELSIKQLMNIQEFTLQCLFSPADNTADVRPGAEEKPKPAKIQVTPGPDSPVYEMYETVFLVVQTYLVVLAVVNVSSLVLRVTRLACKPCREAAPGQRIPLDGILLLQMARENAGPDVVAAFSQTGGWGKEEGKESIVLQE